jgi:hypothetical protein
VKLTAHFSSSAVVENAWNYISVLPHIFMAWCLIQHKNIFLKLETSSLAKKNSCCNKNDCKISGSQSTGASD